VLGIEGVGRKDMTDSSIDSSLKNQMRTCDISNPRIKDRALLVLEGSRPCDGGGNRSIERQSWWRKRKDEEEKKGAFMLPPAMCATPLPPPASNPTPTPTGIITTIITM